MDAILELHYMCAICHKAKCWVRWSGDVITVERAILEQSNIKYELQGEYVLPGSRERSTGGNEKWSLFQKVMIGYLGSMISAMCRWRMRLEVPKAEITEMFRLLGFYVGVPILLFNLDQRL